MAVYQYKAISKSTSKTIKGVIDADSLSQARQKLREQELYPTTINETTHAATAETGVSIKKHGRISTRDLALMTRQLAVLLRAGMPLVSTLAAVVEQVTRPRLKAALFDVRDRVNGGSSFADALAEQPRVFSPLYINMVRAGEASGTLEEVLVRLADILEHHSRLKSQIISSLAYPGFMGVFAVGVIVFMMTFIIPRITSIFERQEVDLPGITLALIAVSDFIASYWFLIIGFILGIYAIWRTWVTRKEGRKTWDRIKLKIPIFGPLHLKLVCARFSRTLGTMLKSGLTMLPALDVVNSVLENTHIQEHMDDVKAGVRRGRDLAIPLKETGLFPPMMIHMVELGQRSGAIEEMLIKVADTYDDDVRLTIDAAVGLLEPIVIIVMGVFVGFLVLAILLPILNMSTSLA